MNNYTKEKLFNLSIHEVRRIGRAVGVRSPTSLRKEDLVDQIFAIYSGSQEKYIAKDKKGRPSKTAFEFEEVLNFKLDDEPKNFFNSTLEFGFPSDLETELFNSKVLPDGEFFGFLDLSYSNIGVIKSKIEMGLKDCVLVSSSIIIKNNLKYGDFVRVKTSKLENGKRFATEVLEVNFQKTRELSKVDFISAPAISPTKQIKFKNDLVLNKVWPIGFGQRALVFEEDELAVKSFIINCYKKAEAEKILVLFDSQIEEVEQFRQDENVICIPSAPAKQINSLIDFIVNSLHRRAEQQKDVVAFVFGSNRLKEILQEASEENIFSQELTSGFKNTKDAGSCTLILGLGMDKVQADKIYSGKFNLQIPLCSNLAIYGVESFVDLRKLSIFRTDLIFTQQAKQIIAEIKKQTPQNEEDLALCIKNLK